MGESMQAVHRPRRGGSGPSTGSHGYATTVAKKRSGIVGAWQQLAFLRVFSAIGRLLRPVLVVLAVPAIAAIAVGGHYYANLSAQIDVRLHSGPLDNSVDIYYGPLIISAGERSPTGTLANYLRALGYTQNQPGDLPRASRAFTIANDVIDIEPGAASGLQAIQVQIGDDGRVMYVRDRRTGRMLESAMLEGKLLSAMRGSDRSRRIPVQFNEIPDSLRNAVLAIEDRRFFSHAGVDWRGIGRALLADVHSGEIVQGGSTLTQQLVKNTFFSPERSFGRKLKEAAMAMIIETRLSKNDIFTLYCNDVYLGQSSTYAIRGFAEATESYFGKSLSGLTLSESAFLAGLLHAPNRYLLMRDAGAGLARRNQVLDAMVSTGAISMEQADAAKNAELQIRRRQIDEDQGATYFLDYMQRFMDTHPASNTHVIHTTLDPALQAAAFNAVTQGCSRIDKTLAHNSTGERVQAALVALDGRTGEVLAMIGGRSYDQGQLNRATDAFRQPGSAFKPIVYAAALRSRAYTLASTISDRPTRFVSDGGTGSYAPNDFRGGFTNRDVTLREALAHSMNVPAVRLAEEVGLSQVADLAEECGVPRPRPYPSMALGTSELSPLQLASAYMVFADGGRAIRPIPIKDRQDRYSYSGSSGASSEFVFSPEVAYLVTSGMESVINSGTAARARRMGVQGAAAGKTGTTDRDGWFVGYTPGLVCAVWVGFEGDGKLGLTGAESALPIWADFIEQTIRLRPELGGKNFSRPAGIVVADIDPTTGMLATPDCARHFNEVFVRGTDPTTECTHANHENEASDAERDQEYPDLPVDAQDGGEGRIVLYMCTETGSLAGPACSHVVRAVFKIGEEPSTVCRPEFHHALMPTPELRGGPSGR